MINLASIRYARVLLKYSGPIERIEYGRLKSVGRTRYQANAYLSSHLNLARPPVQIFSDADGTGTHTSAMIARHMAISEAIERWAYFYLTQSGLTRNNGFDKDSFSTGMAAYPGLFAWQARRRAFAEAVERFCLVAWWNGGIRSRPLDGPNTGHEGIELENPLSAHRVVIVWKRFANGFHAYGFSGNRSLRNAVGKAVIELERSAVAMDHYRKQNPGFRLDDLDAVSNILERRALYYSLPDGHREFIDRVNSPIRGKLPEQQPPLVDTEILGPWSKYATVWRVLFHMPTQAYQRPVANYFYW